MYVSLGRNIYEPARFIDQFNVVPREQPLNARDPFGYGVLRLNCWVAAVVGIAAVEDLRRDLVQLNELVLRHEAIRNGHEVLLAGCELDRRVQSNRVKVRIELDKFF